MKKTLALMALILFCSLTTMAQDNNGGGGAQRDPAARMAMMKERFKAMGCNDVQIDSVMAISNDMRPKMMGLRDMDDETRKTKMKEIADERNKRLEKALPADLAKKVIEAMSMQRPRPQQ
jgi:hypothetical protein